MLMIEVGSMWLPGGSRSCSPSWTRRVPFAVPALLAAGLGLKAVSSVVSKGGVGSDLHIVRIHSPSSIDYPTLCLQPHVCLFHYTQIRIFGEHLGPFFHAFQYLCLDLLVCILPKVSFLGVFLVPSLYALCLQPILVMLP